MNLQNLFFLQYTSFPFLGYTLSLWELLLHGTRQTYSPQWIGADINTTALRPATRRESNSSPTSMRPLFALEPKERMT